MSLLMLLVEAAQHAAPVVAHVAQAAQPATQPSSFDTITLGNIVGAGGILIALFGVWFNLDKRRRETAKEAREDTDRIMTELNKVNTGIAARVEKLETKTADFMTRQEITQEVEHEKTNRQQADRVFETWMNKVETKLDAEVRSADRRLTTLEEKVSTQATAITEIKQLIKEQTAETKELIKEFAEENKNRFDQVCASIREVTKRDAKG